MTYYRLKKAWDIFPAGTPFLPKTHENGHTFYSPMGFGPGMMDDMIQLITDMFEKVETKGDQ